jgi:hypothetical protein
MCPCGVTDHHNFTLHQSFCKKLTNYSALGDGLNSKKVLEHNQDQCLGLCVRGKREDR